MSLVDKIRKARERKVEVGGHAFIIRRPTDVEALALRDASLAELVRFVVGWEMVTEADVLPGGDGHDLPFDAAVAAEWLADRPDLLHPLVEAVMDAYRAHVAALEAAAKK